MKTNTWILKFMGGSTRRVDAETAEDALTGAAEYLAKMGHDSLLKVDSLFLISEYAERSELLMRLNAARMRNDIETKKRKLLALKREVQMLESTLAVEE